MFLLCERPSLEVEPPGLVKDEDVHAPMEQPLPVDFPALHGTNDPIIGVNHIQDLEFFIGTHGSFLLWVARNPFFGHGRGRT